MHRHAASTCSRSQVAHITARRARSIANCNRIGSFALSLRFARCSFVVPRVCMLRLCDSLALVVLRCADVSRAYSCICALVRSRGCSRNRICRIVRCEWLARSEKQRIREARRATAKRTAAKHEQQAKVVNGKQASQRHAMTRSSSDGRARKAGPLASRACSLKGPLEPGSSFQSTGSTPRRSSSGSSRQSKHHGRTAGDKTHERQAGKSADDAGNGSCAYMLSQACECTDRKRQAGVRLKIETISVSTR